MNKSILNWIFIFVFVPLMSIQNHLFESIFKIQFCFLKNRRRKSNSKEKNKNEQNRKKDKKEREKKKKIVIK